MPDSPAKAQSAARAPEQAVGVKGQSQPTPEAAGPAAILLQLQASYGNRAVRDLVGRFDSGVPSVQRDPPAISLVDQRYEVVDRPDSIDFISAMAPGYGVRIVAAGPIARRHVAWQVVFAPTDVLRARPIVRIVKAPDVVVHSFGQALSGPRAPFSYEVYEVLDPADVPMQGADLQPTGRRVAVASTPVGDPQRLLTLLTLAAMGGAAVGLMVPAGAALVEAGLPMLAGQGRIAAVAGRRAWIWALQNPQRATAVGHFAAGQVMQVIASGGLLNYIDRLRDPQVAAQLAFDALTLHFEIQASYGGPSRGGAAPPTEVDVPIELMPGPGPVIGVRTRAAAWLPISEGEGAGASAGAPGVRVIGSLRSQFAGEPAANDNAGGPPSAAPPRAVAVGDYEQTSATGGAVGAATSTAGRPRASAGDRPPPGPPGRTRVPSPTSAPGGPSSEPTEIAGFPIQRMGNNVWLNIPNELPAGAEPVMQRYQALARPGADIRELARTAVGETARFQGGQADRARLFQALTIRLRQVDRTWNAAPRAGANGEIVFEGETHLMVIGRDGRCWSGPTADLGLQVLPNGLRRVDVSGRSPIPSAPRGGGTGPAAAGGPAGSARSDTEPINAGAAPTLAAGVPGARGEGAQPPMPLAMARIDNAAEARTYLAQYQSQGRANQVRPVFGDGRAQWIAAGGGGDPPIAWIDRSGRFVYRRDALAAGPGVATVPTPISPATPRVSPGRVTVLTQEQVELFHANPEVGPVTLHTEWAGYARAYQLATGLSAEPRSNGFQASNGTVHIYDGPPRPSGP